MYRRNARIFAVLFTVIFIIGIILIDHKIKSSLLELAHSKAQLKTVEMINNIVNEKVVDNTDYKAIVSVHTDDQGRIVMVQPNTVELNRIMARTIGEVARSMNNMEGEYIYIPIGQLTGSQIMAGYGPRVKVKIIPTGQVHVNVQNKFEQAGINQSRHLIYLIIDTTLRIAVPFMDKDLKVTTTVPLAETIIIGEVPDTYVNFTGSAGDLYPLIRKNN